MLSPLNKQTPKRTHRLRTLVVLLAWFALLAYAAVHRQDITDWIKLRNYQAPASVALLADQDTLTGYGRKIFYVNHPSITAKQDFGNYCPTSEAEQTIVLGCYHPGQNGIYLLTVTEARLNGVQQVTAAHEMLHGAYERLGKTERTRVDSMLLDFYKKGLQDPRIISTIDAYKKSEPNDLVNEMHSIFGTEIANLPVELEQYYSQYFKNRTQVTAFANQYQAEFTSRQAAVARADAQLKNLKQQIEALEAELKTKQTRITNTQNTLTAQRNSGNIEAYNAGVPAYNALVDDFNTSVERERALVAQYNDLVATRNAIAFEENQLLKNLSTNAETINN